MLTQEGLVHWKLGQNEEAVDVLFKTEAEEVFQSFSVETQAILYHNRAKALSEVGRTEEAVNDVKHAIALDGLNTAHTQLLDEITAK